MMRRLILTALLLTVPLPAMAAGQPSFIAADRRQEAADRLVAALHLEKQFDLIIPQVVTMMLPAFLPGNSGKEMEISKILSEEMITAFAGRRAELVANARDAYSRNFTVEQLEDMIVFYTSPTGKVVVEKLPVVTSESMQGGALIGQKAAQDALPHIFERMRAAQLAIPKGT